MVRLAERRNLVSARVPSHFNWPLQTREQQQTKDSDRAATGIGSVEIRLVNGPINGLDFFSDSLTLDQAANIVPKRRRKTPTYAV